MPMLITLKIYERAPQVGGTWHVSYLSRRVIPFPAYPDLGDYLSGASSANHRTESIVGFTKVPAGMRM
jgi:hypothetical protein